MNIWKNNLMNIMKWIKSLLFLNQIILEKYKKDINSEIILNVRNNLKYIKVIFIFLNLIENNLYLGKLIYIYIYDQ